MRNAVLGLVSLAVLALPNAAGANEGAAAGAVTGAIAGGVVGGPIGAAVGAGVGGIAGGAASDANRPDTVVVAPGSDATGSVGCTTQTVRTENAYGESKTVRTERC
jgi:phage tail tape-measure protein